MAMARPFDFPASYLWNYGGPASPWAHNKDRKHRSRSRSCFYRYCCSKSWHTIAICPSQHQVRPARKQLFAQAHRRHGLHLRLGESRHLDYKTPRPSTSTRRDQSELPRGSSVHNRLVRLLATETIEAPSKHKHRLKVLHTSSPGKHGRAWCHGMCSECTWLQGGV